MVGWREDGVVPFSATVQFAAKSAVSGFAQFASGKMEWDGM